MGKLVPIITQVESKQGEVLVTINLNLTIKLDSDGNVVRIDNKGESAKAPENVKYEMPKMEDNTDLLLSNFGKAVK